MEKRRGCGIFTWFGYVMPIKESLGMIKDAGFDSVCIWWGDDFEELNGKKETHPETAAKAGLKVENAHLPYLGCDALWRDTLEGEAALDYYIGGIKSACDSGINRLVFHPNETAFYKNRGGNEAVFIKRLGRIADEAAARGALIAVENIYELETLSFILDYFADNPNIGMCFDTGHANVCAHGDFSFLEKYSNKLAAIHVHDNDGAQDSHLLPYEGNLNWEKFYAVLEKSGYDGALMLESCSPFDYAAFEEGGSACEKEAARDYLARARRACMRVMGGES